MNNICKNHELLNSKQILNFKSNRAQGELTGKCPEDDTNEYYQPEDFISEKIISRFSKILKLDNRKKTKPPIFYNLATYKLYLESVMKNGGFKSPNEPKDADNLRSLYIKFSSIQFFINETYPNIYGEENFQNLKSILSEFTKKFYSTN